MHVLLSLRTQLQHGVTALGGLKGSWKTPTLRSPWPKHGTHARGMATEPLIRHETTAHGFPVATINMPGQSLPRAKAPLVIMGTNHQDPNAGKDVKDLIRNIRPDDVMIELCPIRAWAYLAGYDIPEATNHIPRPHKLSHGPFNRLDKKDVPKVITRERLRRVFQNFDMGAAAMEARKINAKIYLGDRDMRITSARFGYLLPVKKLVNKLYPEFWLASSAAKQLHKDFCEVLLCGRTGKPTENVQMFIEKICSVHDMLKTELREEYYLAVEQVIAFERDLILAYNAVQLLVKGAGKRRVLVVCGLNHVDGVSHHVSEIISNYGVSSPPPPDDYRIHFSLPQTTALHCLFGRIAMRMDREIPKMEGDVFRDWAHTYSAGYGSHQYCEWLRRNYQPMVPELEQVTF